jgi:Uma2 family endonuclease
MAFMRDIVLPETKPALEWVNGRVLQKVSPQRKHAVAQGRFFSALDAWAREHGCGEVGTEWEFRIAPPDEVRRPLVPDVAYLSYDRVPFDDEEAADIPRVAPDVVVEVLSPRDRRRDVDEKIRVYLAAGTSVVFLVDTQIETVTACEYNGRKSYGPIGVLRNAALPGFALRVPSLFERPTPQRSDPKS